MFHRGGLAWTMSLVLAVGASAASKDLGGGFFDHGVATPVSTHRGTVATADAQGPPLVLSWLMDHRGSYALLLIDVEAKKAEEFPLTFCTGDSPYASILSSRGKFYTHFNSHFVEFDPTARKLSFCRKTAPQMAMSMTEDDQGAIWSASYPQSGLVRFDPEKRELTDFGHVYRQNWSQYPRSVAADDSGWIYAGVGSTANQVLAFDPRTRKAEPLVPEAERRHGSGMLWRGADGKVYCQPNGSQPDRWWVLHAGQRTELPQAPKVRPKPLVASSQGLFHASFPDGRRIARYDLLERVLTVEDPKSKQSTTVNFDYVSEGAHVMGVAAAPDGTICGGSAFPMRFFSYDPTRDRWVHRTAFGQWNTVARQGDRFFAGVYGHGGLLEWDPAAPWRDTKVGMPDCNPKLLAQAHATINRPHKLLAHPDGRTLVLAGTPGYGLTGGGLLFYDRGAGQHVLLTHRDLIPEQSTVSLVALGDQLLGGTTTAAGTGGLKKAQQAELYLLDLKTRRIGWHEPLLSGVQTYNDLCLGPDGKVWGFADGQRFFVFDPATRKIIHDQTTDVKFGRAVSHQGPRIFVAGPDKVVYALFVRAITRIEPVGWKFHLLAKPPVPISAGGDYLNGRIYFVSGSRLYSFKLP